jgi:CHAT domain-containing protein
VTPFQSEKRSIKDAIETVGVGVNWVIDAASVNNLFKILDTFSPTILHISCHGEFIEDGNDFYLAFEDGDKFGHLYKLTCA